MEEENYGPAVTLVNCGGERLNIIAHILVVLSQGERKTDAIVMVQKGAPHSLLLGTDLKVRLGFSLFSETNGRRVHLLKAALLQTSEELQDRQKKLKWAGRLHSHGRQSTVEGT